VPQPRDTWAELWFDGVQMQRLQVPQGSPNQLRWTVPTVAAGRLVECRVRCGTFVPMREGLGQDSRELGLHVASIRTA